VRYLGSLFQENLIVVVNAVLWLRFVMLALFHKVVKVSQGGEFTLGHCSFTNIKTWLSSYEDEGKYWEFKMSSNQFCNSLACIWIVRVYSLNYRVRVEVASVSGQRECCLLNQTFRSLVQLLQSLWMSHLKFLPYFQVRVWSHWAWVKLELWLVSWFAAVNIHCQMEHLNCLPSISELLGNVCTVNLENR